MQFIIFTSSVSGYLYVVGNVGIDIRTLHTYIGKHNKDRIQWKMRTENVTTTTTKN